jgi:hypothetical protein
VDWYYICGGLKFITFVVGGITFVVITFVVDITFVVKDLLHLWLLLHFITFVVDYYICG